jgi:hypothetical protein
MPVTPSGRGGLAVFAFRFPSFGLLGARLVPGRRSDLGCSISPAGRGPWRLRGGRASGSRRDSSAAAHKALSGRYTSKAAQFGVRVKILKTSGLGVYYWVAGGGRAEDGMPSSFSQALLAALRKPAASRRLDSSLRKWVPGPRAVTMTVPPDPMKGGFAGGSGHRSQPSTPSSTADARSAC